LGQQLSQHLGDHDDRVGAVKHAILDLLKREGPQDASTLGGQLGVSAMAVRQHLYELRDEALVDYAIEPRPVGRPAKLWRLAEAADRLFPDGHAALTTAMIGAIAEAFGGKGLETLLEVQARDQIAAYEGRVAKTGALAPRVKALADLRAAEGYMAEVEADADGAFLLVENHCPIAAAARACSGLCAAELTVFRTVLGDEVEIRRTEHLLAGERRCAYRVRPRRG